MPFSSRLLSLSAPLARSSQAATRTTALATSTARLAAARPSIRPGRPGIAAYLPRVSKAYYAGSPYDKIDRAAEKESAKKKLEAHPDQVTAESTVANTDPAPAPAHAQGGGVSDGLQHDIGIVKDTFKMADVPREPFALGLAGTIPYLFTSMSTVYLSWDLNTEWPSSSAFLNHFHMNHDDAQSLLSLLEPVQLGYGAIIISFLGAVHWGMEYAARDASAERTRFRYAMGVIAPVVAWPTLLMPIEAALTSQFAAFTLLYMADTNATTRGWTPAWYGRYRFILTAIVGVAIFVSLVGRAKIGNAAPRLGQGLSDSMHKNRTDPSVDWAKLEEKEKQKNREEKEKAEREKKKQEEEDKKKEKKSASKSQGGEKSKSKDAKEEDGEKSDAKKGEDKKSEDKKGEDKKGEDKKDEEDHESDQEQDGSNAEGKAEGKKVKESS